MNRRHFLISAALATGAFARPLHAETLYAAPPSASSAFVRFIGASGTQYLNWDGVEIGLSAYVEGEYLAIESGEIGVDAGVYVTAVVADNIVQQHFVEAPQSTGKVGFHFLNLSSQTSSLMTPDGTIEIFSSVASGELKSRDINPLSFEVQTHSTAGNSNQLAVNVKRESYPLVILSADQTLRFIDSRMANNG